MAQSLTSHSFHTADLSLRLDNTTHSKYSNVRSVILHIPVFLYLAYPFRFPFQRHFKLRWVLPAVRGEASAPVVLFEYP